MKIHALFLAISLAACGGGVDDSTKLTDLSNDEEIELCEEFADDYPVRTVTCGNVSIEFGIDKAECTMGASEPTPSTCTATVGQVRACYDALFNQTDAQLCDPNAMEPAACAVLEGC